MPMNPPKPCGRPGCNKYAVKLSRCNDHQTQPQGVKVHDIQRPAWSTTTTSRHERGYGTQWDKIRIQILRRDNYLCVEHQRRGQLVEAYQVDHIKPKAQEGDDSLDNLQSLCVQCHKEKTQKEARHGQKNNPQG